MKIQILESTDTNIKFVLKDSFISYANAIRRILISEVPTVTIDLVEIEINNTALPDEIISSRLGLIPIYVHKDLLFRDQCDCTDSCSKCSIDLTIFANNNNNEPLIVTCKDFKYDTNLISIKNAPIIAKLGANQSLKVKCKAFKGTGSIHAKWSPVSTVGFEYDKGNKTRSTNFWRENDQDTIAEDESDLLVKINEIEMNVEIVEGFGRPLDILVKALEILKNKFNYLKKDLIQYI